MSFSILKSWLRDHKGFIAVLLLALACALGVEILRFLVGSRRETLFWDEFFLGDGLIAWLQIMMVMMCVPLLRLTRTWNWRALGAWTERHIAWICVAGAIFYAFLMRFAAFGLAYTPDESSAVLQAQTFAALKLSPRVAPDLVASIIPAWLQGNILLLSTETGRYSPTYWPGYAFLMAPFARLGLEWLCNPILTALSLGLLFKVTKKLLDSAQAGVWAVVFALVSAQIALNAATFYAMPAHLGANLLFVWFFIQNTRRAAFFAGLVGGFALVLHNPVPHLSFALPWIVWTLIYRRVHLTPLLGGYALLALPVGIGWSIYLDSFRISPYVDNATLEQATKTVDSSAFSQVMSRVAFVFRPPSFDLLLTRVAGAIKIVEWAALGLIAFAALGWRSAARMRSEKVSQEQAHYLWLLGASVVTNFAVYLFIRFDQGHGWGFRYMHQTWLAFPILAAWALMSWRESAVCGFSVRRFAAMLCVVSALLLLPLRAVQARLFIQNVLRDRPPAPPPGPSMTFIGENQSEAATFIINDPFLRNSDWKLRFATGEENERLARRYLAGARRVQSGKWGEIWSGSAFVIPPSPDSK